jgi:hypothetical protein
MTKERMGKVADVLLKELMKGERLRINGVNGYVAESARRVGVSVEETRAFMATMSSAALAETLSIPGTVTIFRGKLAELQVNLVELSEERKGQLALLFLKNRVRRETERMSGFMAKIGEISAKTGVPVEELVVFTAILISELLAEEFSKSRFVQKNVAAQEILNRARSEAKNRLKSS